MSFATPPFAPADTPLTQSAASSIGLQQVSATERAERARNAARAQALAGQKKARDDRVLARRLEGITRLLAAGGSGIDGNESESDEEEGSSGRARASDVNTPASARSPSGDASMEVEASRITDASTGARKTGKRRKGKDREALQDVLTYAHLFTLSPTIASPPLPTSAELIDGYLALGPVPNGKRCLLVTGPSRGASAPTTLHTRVSARVLLKWVAPLPGGTVLDCLLPTDWKAAGTLYVLDCLRWKDLDIAASGASLRQFFLRSRLAELPSSPPVVPRPDGQCSHNRGYKHPTSFLPLLSFGPPIRPDQWATLRTAGMSAGEGVMILGADGSYVTGAERDVGEAWWVGPEEVDDLLAVVSGLAHPADVAFIRSC